MATTDKILTTDRKSSATVCPLLFGDNRGVVATKSGKSLQKLHGDETGDGGTASAKNGGADDNAGIHRSGSCADGNGGGWNKYKSGRIDREEGAHRVRGGARKSVQGFQVAHEIGRAHV